MIGSKNCLCRPFCEAPSGGRASLGKRRGYKNNGEGAESKEDQKHSPVLEEENLPADLRDAIKDNVLFADLRSDGSQRRGGASASASVSVWGGPWEGYPTSDSPQLQWFSYQAEPQGCPPNLLRVRRNRILASVEAWEDRETMAGHGGKRVETPEIHGTSHFINALYRFDTSPNCSL